MANPLPLMRRVAGRFDIRLDGIGDLLFRAPGATVMDVGCNRGLVANDFALNGATIVHGCDIEPECIDTARHIFADKRNVKSKFEVVDLTKGPAALAPFGDTQYTITVLLAIVHKIKRVMKREDLSELMKHFARRTQLIGWRATAFDEKANAEEFEFLGTDFKACGFKLAQYSTLSDDVGPAAIWKRQ